MNPTLHQQINQANAKRIKEMCMALPITQRTKVYDEIFNHPIPDWLKYKN